MNRLRDTNTTDAFLLYQFISSGTYGVLSILIIGGNSFCLLVLRRANYLKTTTRLFMVSLTCADMFIGIFHALPYCFVSAAVKTSPSYVWGKICFASSILYAYFAVPSVGSLMSVNISRYITIEFPLKHTRWITTRRAWVILCLLWGSSLTSLLTFIIYPTIKGSEYVYNYNINSCDIYLASDINKIVLPISCVCFTLIPVFVLLAIYARILYIVTKLRGSRLGLQVTHVTNLLHRRDDQKALKRFLLIGLVSSMTWVPFYVYVYIETYNIYPLDSIHHLQYIKLLVHAVALCNNWINILMYTIRDRSFRDAARQVFMPRR